MEEPHALYSVQNGVATITLNRPDKLNALTPRMGEDLRAHLRRASDDDAVRVIVLTGAGRGFCAGADMGNLQSIQDEGDSAPRSARSIPLPFDPDARADFQKSNSYFPAVPKPIIAAINGPCAGLGMILALYCDLRFVADTAVFSTAFSRRGLIAEHGVSWLLPRLVGMAHAMDLLLSARKVTAEEAERMGLVNRAFAAEDLMRQTMAYADMLAREVSPRSVQVMKRQLWNAQFQSLGEAVDVGDAEMLKSFDSEDFKEGVAHFVERRAPAFTGR